MAVRCKSRGCKWNDNGECDQAEIWINEEQECDSFLGMVRHEYPGDIR